MRLQTFYQDVNKNWLASHKIAADNDSISIFEILEANVRKACIKSIHNERGRGTRFGDFIESIYTGRHHDLTFVMDLIDNMTASWTNMSDCFRTMGHLNTYGLRTPLTIETSYDIYNNDHYNLYLTEPDLGILKDEYKTKSETYNAYKGYLRKFFTAAKLGDSSKFLETETAISKTLWDLEDIDSPELTYNPHTLGLLKSRYPAIDFEALFAGYGVDPKVVATGVLVITNPQFLELLNKWVTTKSLGEWRSLVKSMALLSLSGVFPEPFKSLHFDFFNRFLSGQTRPYTADHEAFLICDEVCPDLLGRAYIETQMGEHVEIRGAATDLCKRIVSATKNRIDKLNWMSDGSKAIAKAKVDAMGLKIGYPDIWQNELAGVEVVRGGFMMNLLMARKQETLLDIRRLLGITSNDRRQWANPCYTVNAFYYPEVNELCIPTGFLQPPFFSLQASYIKNLAGLGNVVGHEISHGFDEEGHKYDTVGNFYPWWTSIDVEMYKNRTRQLVDAYNKETYYGNRINGELTLGENLADFGAVAIGMDIIKTRGNSPSELREYFIEYAKSWASKERDAKRRQDAKANVHPPAQLRVNVVLKHFDQFYTAFTFGPDEPGGIPAEERIDVWGR